MADSADAAARTTLSHWLRLLWNLAPPLHLNSEQPFIAAGAIHLPAQIHWQQHAAAAAHAAAHLVYSPRRFESEGLGTIARALTGLLEDARVEALAVRELPGLARLWRPLHTATPASGADFETLLQRLARALADPAYDDPHVWVRKGRALFFGEAGYALPALHGAGDVRGAAMRLGHDIGQARLQFNAKTYRVAPGYRDDHRWMWPADVLTAAPPPARAPAGDTQDDETVRVTSATVTRHAEWDRLISRLRPDWCGVIETAAQDVFVSSAAGGDENLIRHTAAQLRGSLRTLLCRQSAARRSEEGEVFDPAALVDWQVARRRHQASEPRVYRAPATRAVRAAVWLLIDQSASTAAAYDADGHSVLQTATTTASATALALQALGMRCTVAGFHSNGRHAVRMAIVKSFTQPVDEAMQARLRGLRPAGSTRLGAALRHAAQRLAAECDEPRWVLLISDGEPHDVDVHDPRYLIDDARHAVMTAARSGVHMACLLPGQGGAGPARRIFGAGAVQTVHGLADVPRALRRLLG